MLVQFTVQNFLSFKEEVTFSMVGVNADQQHLDHLSQDAVGKGKFVLPIAAIYGANAAGKSNLIKAIDFAKDLILEGTRFGKSIPVKPFKLSANFEKPTKFEFIFLHKDILYSYGFTLDTTQIFEEWLYVTPPKKQESRYFDRETSKAHETKVKYGSVLAGRSKKNKQFLDFIAQGTRFNQLLLTEAVNHNVTELEPILEWFDRCLIVISAESRYQALEPQILVDAKFTEFLSSFLQYSDTGISGIEAREIPLDFDKHFPSMPDEVKADIIQKVQEADEDTIAIFGNSQGQRYLLSRNQQKQLTLIQLKTQHQTETGKFTDFSIEEESDGTQRIMNLVPALFVLKEEAEQVIILDELDCRLHPLLSRQFVQIALGCRDRTKKNQLIFTTHDTNLLDLELLRRDEIWFVEKNKSGESHLYSLAEFNIRPDLKVEKGYLNGRFGGIPFLGDIGKLGWVDCDSTEDPSPSSQAELTAETSGKRTSAKI